MRKQTSIEDKFKVLQSTLSEQQTFIMADVEAVFPDLSTNRGKYLYMRSTVPER